LDEEVGDAVLPEAVPSSEDGSWEHDDDEPDGSCDDSSSSDGSVDSGNEQPGPQPSANDDLPDPTLHAGFTTGPMAAINELPSFAPSSMSQYDAMHTIGGVVKVRRCQLVLLTCCYCYIV
jgi:hypothetical protein